MTKNFKIADGVSAVFIPNDRFKTTSLTVRFFLPLRKETVTANAILADILKHCSREYPEMKDISLKTASLYGAGLGSSADKFGDNQVISFSVTAIDDEYALDGESVFSKAAELLVSLLFDPKTENGAFLKEDVDRERRLFSEKIKSEIVEKRIYAKNKCIAEMCKDEPFGLSRFGFLEAAENITGEELFSAWERMLLNSTVRISVIGKTCPDIIFEAFKKAFSGFERSPIKPSFDKEPKTPQKVNTVTERMDVSQGKLCMGFRTGLLGSDLDTYPLSVMTDIFGGGPYSKLFTYVREKLSLCYYCAARVNRKKGIIMVESGVDESNAKKAKDEILNQLELIKKGDFSDEDLKKSVLGMKDALGGLQDTVSGTERWYSERAFEENPITPLKMTELMEKLTREDIINAARNVTLDTVYFLLPKKEGMENE